MSTAVLYSNAVSLANEIHQNILSLNVNYNHQQYQMAMNSLQQLDSAINDLNRLGKSQVQQEKKLIITQRVHQLRLDYSQINDELQQIKQREQQRLALEQREQLMGAQLNHRPNTKAEATFLDMDLREEQVLNDAGQSIDQYIQIGRNALGELYDQRNMLKNAQKRLLDTASRLGLSNSVMRFIEQRSATDRYILYGLIVGSVIIMWAIVHYLG